MKILMIVFHYPPLNEMASSRSFSFAKYWSRMGHQVTVVTPKKYSYHGKLNYMPKDKEDIELIEVDYAKWFTKRFEKGDVAKETSLNGVRKVIRFLRKNLIGNSFDTQKLWENAVFKEADKLANERDFDFIFSSFSPPVTHVIASKLKYKYPKLFWVADYRDLWSGNHLLKTNRLLGYFQQKKEKKLLNYSDLIVTVSDGFKQYLESFHNREIHTIFNGYDYEEIQSISKNPFFQDDNKIRFVYTGTIYIGTRDPSPFFKALKRLEIEGLISPRRLEVWFFGDSANVADLAQSQGVEKYVKIGGFISKEDSYRVQRDADGLLFLEHELEENSLSSKGTIPAKVYESLLAKTEIFAIGVSSDSFVGELIEKSLVGTTYKNDVDKLYTRLKEFIQIKGRQVVISPDISIMEKYSREKNAQKLIELVEKYL